MNHSNPMENPPQVPHFSHELYQGSLRPGYDGLALCNPPQPTTSNTTPFLTPKKREASVSKRMVAKVVCH